MPVVNPGIRRLLASAIQRLFNGASFSVPLTHSAIPTRAASGTTGTFTRATTATVRDNEGVLRTAIAGEARFEGARRVRNLLTQTTDTSGANWTKGTVTVSGEVITATAGAGNHWTYQSFTSTSGNKYIASVKAKAGTAGFIALGWGNAATSEGVYFNLTNGAKGTTNGTISGNISGPDDDGYYTCSINKTTPTGNVSVEIHTSDNQAITWSAAGTETVYVKELQLEDVTAQTTQTAGEYVSVGALDYRSTNDPLYLSLPGTNGHCATTPDSAAASPTGDIELIFDGAATDWTPTADQVLICKDDAGVQRDILLFLRLATARVELWTSATGASYAGRAASATAALPFADGQRGQIKVTRSAATGDTNFYTSTDGGGTWAQLGTTVSTTAGAIHDGSAGITVGAIGDASKTAPFGGKIYNATLATSIGGTPVVDFNPHRDATTPTGTITSSTTGEVWTINGASSVVRNAAYHGSMVDGVKCFPTDLSGNPIPSTTMLGYLAEGARTNLVTYSNGFDNAAWSKLSSGTGSAPIVTANYAVAPDGTTTAYRLQLNRGAGAGSTNYSILRSTAASGLANPHTSAESLWVKTTGGGTATILFGSSYAGGYSVTVTGEWTRLDKSQSVPQVIDSIDIYLRDGVSLTNDQSADILIWGAQLELGSFASSYIATTTIAVARNADVLTYSSAGNIDGTKGWAYAEVAINSALASVGSDILAANTGGNAALLSDGGPNLRIYDGTAYRQFGVAIPHGTTPAKISASYGGSSSNGAVNGTIGSASSFDGNMNSGANIYVGIRSTGANEIAGTIRNVRIGQRQLSSSELQAVTS